MTVFLETKSVTKSRLHLLSFMACISGPAFKPEMQLLHLNIFSKSFICLKIEPTRNISNFSQRCLSHLKLKLFDWLWHKKSWEYVVWDKKKNYLDSKLCFLIWNSLILNSIWLLLGIKNVFSIFIISSTFPFVVFFIICSEC